MAVQNKFFTNGNISDGAGTTIRKKDQREELLNTTIAESLNKYKNFAIFPAYSPAGSGEIKYNKLTKNEETRKVGAPAVRSLFNNYSAVLTGADGQNIKGLGKVKNWGVAPEADVQKKVWNATVKNTNQWRVDNNVPLLDTPTTRRRLNANSNRISVRDLVEATKSGELGRMTYAYSDFMYCKYLNRVSNNYLITLRRYPMPVLDSMKTVGYGRRKKGSKTTTFGRNSEFADPHRQAPQAVGTMVTWLGVSGNELNSILKYNYHMSFQEQTASMQELESIGGGDSGPLNVFEGLTNKAARTRIEQGFGAANPALSTWLTNNVGGFLSRGGGIGLADGPYQWPPRRANKVYGPIDKIHKNYRRSDEGLEWDMKFTLTFEYELRAYNGINPRQAMLDLLASILAVTYTNGTFFHGGHYPVAQGQSSAFRNLAVFKAQGGWSNYMDAIAKDFKVGTQKLTQFVKDQGGFLGAAKAALNAIGGLLMGGLINRLGRPRRYAPIQTVSDAPSGLWHVTIGNPWRPIVMLGNLILKDTEIVHSGPLGLDDFPTDLKVTCSFDRGKPRDIYGVEQMYMSGSDRIFHSMSKKVMDMYKAAIRYGGESLPKESDMIEDAIKAKREEIKALEGKADANQMAAKQKELEALGAQQFSADLREANTEPDNANPSDVSNPAVRANRQSISTRSLRLRATEENADTKESPETTPATDQKSEQAAPATNVNTTSQTELDATKVHRIEGVAQDYQEALRNEEDTRDDTSSAGLLNTGEIVNGSQLHKAFQDSDWIKEAFGDFDTGMIVFSAAEQLQGNTPQKIESLTVAGDKVQEDDTGSVFAGQQLTQSNNNPSQ